MYQLRITGNPPLENERLKANYGAGKGTGKPLRRSTEASDYQRVAGLQAQAALRGLGVNAPLKGPLVVLYLTRIPKGQRDWSASLKDLQDALQGIAWENDRQIVFGSGIIDRKADVAEVVVYFAPVRELAKLTALAETLTRALYPEESP